MNIKSIKQRAGAFGLAALMSLSLAVPGLAAESGTSDPTKDVTATYIGASGKPVYSFAYSWGSMEFNYSGPSSGTWDPKTHQFTGESSAGGWSCAAGADEIKVVNHSNAPINVRLSFEAAKEGFKGGFDKNNFTLPSAVDTTYDEAPSETVRFGPAQENTVVPSEGETGVKLGTITLHVTGA